MLFDLEEPVPGFLTPLCLQVESNVQGFSNFCIFDLDETLFETKAE